MAEAVTEEEEEKREKSSSKSTSSRFFPCYKDLKHSFYLAKTILRSSAVLQVVRGHLRTPSSDDIVFGKETSIELVRINEDGIVQSVCDQPVFGTIKDLSILPWNEVFHARSPKLVGKDLLVVISDSGKLSFLTFCSEMHRFFPLAHEQLSPPGNLRSDGGRMLAVDSSGCFIAASAFQDKLALMSVSASSCTDMVDVRIFWPPENGNFVEDVTRVLGTIWSMCFISQDINQQSIKHTSPLLAIVVNRRRTFQNELLLVEWNVRDEAVRVMFQFSEAGPLAHHIIEVPNSFGFAFLFRTGDALLMDFRDSQNPCCIYKSSVGFTSNTLQVQNLTEPTDMIDMNDEDEIISHVASALLELRNLKKSVSMDIDIDTCMKPGFNYACSWSWEPGTMNNPRMIVSADSGDLFMVEMMSDSDEVKVNISESLYKYLPFKAILWVEGGLLAAIVEMGDGMVLKVEAGCIHYRSPIQNLAPILDMEVVDYPGKKCEQLFACCGNGMASEGSLRIIRSGISVDKLLTTPAIYQGITGIWAVKLRTNDAFHSFLVISYVEETRVLSVGLSFYDVTDSLGFLDDVCTLACGLVADSLVVQIYQSAVRICMHVNPDMPEAISSATTHCSSWSPGSSKINVGAVAKDLIVVATSSPCCLFILGIRSSATYEIFQRQQVRLQNELSCISISRSGFENEPPTRLNLACSILSSIGISNDFLVIIGTHKPSVEVLSFSPDTGLKVLAVGSSFLTNTVPQDVQLVLFDHPYILAGLRNGMLLRFEWPASSAVSSSSTLVDPAAVGNISPPCGESSVTWMSDSFDKTNNNFHVDLHVVSTRRIGITPVFLIPLSNCLAADIIALSDRPWLLHTARQSLSYTSISFEPATHATPVCFCECPKGILFVTENRLHLVEMDHSKRINMQKFYIDGTPRKILYHSGSKLLLVLRTDLLNGSYSSDICCVDPVSGSVLSTFIFNPGETGKCMDLVKVGEVDCDFVLVVGTKLSDGPAIMSSGEAERTKGRLVVLCLEHVQNSDPASMSYRSGAGSLSHRSSLFCDNVGFRSGHVSGGSICSNPDDDSCDGLKLKECKTWHLRLACSRVMPGAVFSVCTYVDYFFLASAGNAFYLFSFHNDNPQRMKRWAAGRTRFMITNLTTYKSRIAVGDSRDGVLFYSYNDDTNKFEPIYCDPVQRLVADCILMDVDTAVVSDRKGGIAALSIDVDEFSPIRNLSIYTEYYMGEIAMCIWKGSFCYKLPGDDGLCSCSKPHIIGSQPGSIMVSTLLGSIMTILPLCWGDYKILEWVQARVASHPLTAPILGNSLEEYRSRERSSGGQRMVDGDMVSQFLDLTRQQQEAVLALHVVGSDEQPVSSADQVVRLVERVISAFD